MGKGRLEAFSDGVIAVIITIMVLEMKVPHGADLEALRHVLPTFFSYVLSFVYVGIYWNNHHHLMHTVKRVAGAIMWANLHLLFWLSLIPFTTGWAGENHFAAWPTALYGFVLFMAGVAYMLLERAIIACHGGEASMLASAVGSDRKATISAVGYAAGVLVAFAQPLVSNAIYAGIALMWLIPDRRIQSRIEE
ncbi:MAG TPA: TMEM175 family protein [Nevskiaceae bacterium]|nr:TMEM175 family protein [Nevskiaceae bacterium]